MEVAVPKAVVVAHVEEVAVQVGVAVAERIVVAPLPLKLLEDAVLAA